MINSIFSFKSSPSMNLPFLLTLLPFIALSVNAAPIEENGDEEEFETFNIRVDDLLVAHTLVDDVKADFASIDLDPKSYYCVNRISDDVIDAIFDKEGLANKIFTLKQALQEFDLLEEDFFCV